MIIFKRATLAPDTTEYKLLTIFFSYLYDFTFDSGAGKFAWILQIPQGEETLTQDIEDSTSYLQNIVIELSNPED